MNYILDMIPGIKKDQINNTRKCSTCKFYDKNSEKYGMCTNLKTNKYIFISKNTDKKVLIQVPRFGICKFYKVIGE